MARGDRESPVEAADKAWKSETRPEDPLEDMTGSVFGRMSEALPNRSFDPRILLTIAEIVVDILEQCKAARGTEAIVAHASRRSLLSRVIVRRKVRKELARSEYRQYGDQLVDALLDEAEQTKEGPALIQEVLG